MARGGHGQRFALLSEPDFTPCGIVIYVHPFGEEMNKSRHMVTRAIQGFVDDGWAVLQVDLNGCGDSSGDFSEASWCDWIDDLSHAVQWCRERFAVPICLWGLRSGCLLIAEWLTRSGESLPLLFWQPVLNGKQHLTQFLRLKAAAEMLTDADSRNVMSEMRKRLDAGEAVEVAGYLLAPAMASGLSAAILDLPEGFSATVVVLEVSAAENASVSPACKAAIARWSSSGTRVSSELVPGPAFWSTQYLETVPELVAASRRSLAEVLQ